MYLFIPYTPPMYKRIRNLLNSLAVDPLSSGYQYLEDILEITTSERRNEYTTVGMLYAEVAKAHGVNPTSVGVAVRRAIAKAWLRADFELEYSIFGNIVLFKRGMPTCSDFIANTTKYLLLRKR